MTPSEYQFLFISFRHHFFFVFILLCYSVAIAVVDLHAINNFSHAFNANHSENKLLIIIN